MQSIITHAKRFPTRAKRTKQDIVVEAVTLDNSFRASFRYNAVLNDDKIAKIAKGDPSEVVEIKKNILKGALKEFDLACAALRAELTNEIKGVVKI